MAVVLPLNDEVAHCPSGFGYARVPLMMHRSNMMLRNLVMAKTGEVELMLGFFLSANVYVLTIFCIFIFSLLFCLQPSYAFSVFFSCINLPGKSFGNFLGNKGF